MNNELTLPFDGRLAISPNIDNLTRIKSIIVFRETTPGKMERITVPFHEEGAVFNISKATPSKSIFTWSDVKFTIPAKGRGYFEQQVKLNIEIEFDRDYGLVHVTSDGSIDYITQMIEDGQDLSTMNSTNPQVLFGSYIVEYEITAALNQTE